MPNYQTLSGQIWHLTDQIKFDYLPYIINGEVNKFTTGKQMSRNFQTLSILGTGVAMFIS